MKRRKTKISSTTSAEQTLLVRPRAKGRSPIPGVGTCFRNITSAYRRLLRLAAKVARIIWLWEEARVTPWQGARGRRKGHYWCIYAIYDNVQCWQHLIISSRDSVDATYVARGVVLFLSRVQTDPTQTISMKEDMARLESPILVEVGPTTYQAAKLSRSP